MVSPALQAAARLSDYNVHCAVVNCRFVKPLDRPLLREIAATTPLIITAEENVLSGGFGSQVRAELGVNGHASPDLECIGMPDQFVEHGSQSILRSKYGLTADAIVQRILDRLQNQAPAAEPADREISGSGSIGA
jgi:1-deoxy-D-xylulose-5-phosphate synthase